MNDSDSLEHFAEVVDSVINANFRAGNDGDSQGTDSNQRNDSDQSVSSVLFLTVEKWSHRMRNGGAMIAR